MATTKGTPLNGTSKCRALLTLGLSVTEVASLTGKTWNAVHGINYRMRTQGRAPQARQASPQVAGLPLTPFEFNFSRRYGIEIEFLAPENKIASIITDLNVSGIECIGESYNHTTRPHWKIVTDGSLSGRGMVGRELVSPILAGEEGLRQLEVVCEVLEHHGARVNTTTGVHIHVDAANLDLTAFKNLAHSALNTEEAFQAIMPASRRNNSYCRRPSSYGLTHSGIDNCQTINDLVAKLPNRYCTLNLQAYLRHRTVEFRQHAGSTDYLKLANWVRTCVRMVEYAAAGRVANGLNDFLDTRLQGYYIRRERKFSSLNN